MTNEPGYVAASVGTKFCFACGQVIDTRAEICPKCGVRQADVVPAGPAPSSAPRSILSGLAIVSGVIALIIFPVVFGPLGVVLAGLGMVRNEPLWGAALAVAIVGMIVGMVFGALVYLLAA